MTDPFRPPAARDEGALRRRVAEAVERLRRNDPAGQECEALDLELPAAGVHPLDDAAFDLDTLLGWLLELPGEGPCRDKHQVAAAIGWHQIGRVVIASWAAPAADGAAVPGVFVAWARCKVCYWPVWTLSHTWPPPGETASGRPGFYQACGWAGATRDDWRLLTPVRARAVGVPWPVPWPFLTSRAHTGAPW